MDIKASVSEDNGIDKIKATDIEIYSAGISTGGVAEIRMAEANPRRHIIATTLDKVGAKFARKFIADNSLSNQIDVRIEDVAKPLPHKDNQFDFVYARLILHYLTKQELPSALAELYRLLKQGGRLFVVVRSTDCEEATSKAENFDPETNLTTYTIPDKKTGKRLVRKRYFQTEQSISNYVTEAGFDIDYIKKYDEQLYRGFLRNEISPVRNNVIELLAIKS